MEANNRLNDILDFMEMGLSAFARLLLMYSKG